MLGMHGIRYGIKNPEVLKSELKALKRVSENNKKIGLLLPQVISVEELKKVKEVLNEINFPQAKVGIMVETPAAVQLIKEFCKEGINFISFGTNDLTQYMLALDRGNEQVQELYDEMHPAILYQLEYVIRICKRNHIKTSICGQAGSKKEMVKFLVEKGIDSISVNADVASEIANYVAELEKEQGEEPRQYQFQKKIIMEDGREKLNEIEEESKEVEQNEEFQEDFVKPQNNITKNEMNYVKPPMEFNAGLKKYEPDIEETVKEIEKQKSQEDSLKDESYQEELPKINGIEERKEDEDKSDKVLDIF